MSKEKNMSKNDIKRNNAKSHAKANKNSTTSYGAYIGLFISLVLIVAYIGYSVLIQFGVISSGKKAPGLLTADELSQELDKSISTYGGVIAEGGRIS